MAATPGGGAPVDLNGVTHVTVVAAPAAGVTRVVTALRIFNRDSAAVTPTLVTYDGANEREYDKVTGLAAGAVRDIVTRERRIILTSTMSLKMFLAGAIAATNPVVHVAYLDIS